MRIRPSIKLRQSGSLLVIVMWIAFGLISIALYFGDSARFEMQAADNRSASAEAEEAVEGAARYVGYLLANLKTPGVLPEPNTYLREAAQMGEARFWIIGRGDKQESLNSPVFALVDESSKLNLNTASSNMLSLLPLMTEDISAAILDWRDTDEDLTPGGAESETYMRLPIPYLCKNGRFETVEELRLVQGVDMQALYGEDANLNGALDLNEDDGAINPPEDNKNGRLNPGLLEYFTVFTKEPATNTNGTNRVQVSDNNAIRSYLRDKFGDDRSRTLMGGLAGPPSQSVLEFYVRSGMTEDELLQIETDIRGSRIEGLVNVNTASEDVLACIPGIGVDKAPTLVASRQSSGSKSGSIGWVSKVLDAQTIAAAGPWLTGRSYQFTADIAAVGHYGRGYHRVRFVFDLTEGAPRIVSRRDLTHLGWALGRQTRQNLLLANNRR